jgi:Zn-dependent peptidase ImmA (M78 family)
VKKADLDRLAIEIRGEFGLTKVERFDPFAAAEAYGVSVIQASRFPEIAAGFAHFRVSGASRLSALVSRQGGRTFIVEDDTHAPRRRRSNVSHEMAHVFLEHLDATHLCQLEPGAHRSKDPLEVDATELGARLLFPDESAKYCAAYRWTLDQIVAGFDISENLAKWRWRMSGAERIAGSRGR